MIPNYYSCYLIRQLGAIDHNLRPRDCAAKQTHIAQKILSYLPQNSEFGIIHAN
jgi:hypothetical protein